MIAWSILAAQTADIFDHVIVSTEDDEIAEVAQAWGAEIPFRRPSELADDYTGTTEVVAHATEWVEQQNWPVTAVCCIYATAPFVQVEDIKRGLEALEAGDWQYVFSATDFAAPIFRSFKLHPEGGVEMFFPEFFSTRSQNLPRALHDAAQFYWGRPSAWIAKQRMFDRHSMPVILPRWRVQDIDNLEDWERAEMIFPLVKNNR